MPLLHRPNKLLKTFIIVLGLASLHGTASAESVATLTEAAPVIQAGIGAEPVGSPGMVPILALSVAAITMVRRRVRH